MPHPRRTPGRCLLAVAALLLAIAAACSSDPSSGDPADADADAITVTGGRVAVDSDPTSAAIYLTVRNDGDADDQLTGACCTSRARTAGA
jgi:copper(I)-binding protein